MSAGLIGDPLLDAVSIGATIAVLGAVTGYAVGKTAEYFRSNAHDATGSDASLPVFDKFMAVTGSIGLVCGVGLGLVAGRAFYAQATGDRQTLECIKAQVRPLFAPIGRFVTGAVNALPDRRTRGSRHPDMLYKGDLNACQ